MPTIIRYNELASTNDTAMALALADSGTPPFTAVVANRQTAGRGRNGNAWVSPPDAGLYVSFILRPRLDAEHIALLTLVAGIAVAESVAEIAALPARLKWPNDVLVNDRKIAGILCEADFSQPAPVVIAGIGVNVNTPCHALPVRPIFPASSLLVESGKTVDRDALLDDIRDRLAFCVSVLESENGTEQIVAKWNDLNALRDRRIRVVTPTETHEGRCHGIDLSGSLLVETAPGLRHAVIAGEVRLCDASCEHPDA